MKLKNAQIECVDYSRAMLGKFEDRIRGEDGAHIRFSHGDVGALEFCGETFDAVLSMNGYHCVPDKEKAIFEMRRVLKIGGILIGSTYVSGESKRSDFLVKQVYERKGIFIPPYENACELKEHLGGYFTVERFVLIGSFASFCCRRIV